MSKEEIVNMPLKPEIKKLLEQQADENRRATNREAQSIVEREILKRAKKFRICTRRTARRGDQKSRATI